MAVLFFNEDTKLNLKGKRLLKKWIKESVYNEEKTLGNINFIFTSDKYLLEINNKYLSHNYLTDIVTFDYCENNIVNGDIYISIETVKNNSYRFNVTYLEELRRVIIHGVLHLIGYSDSDEKEKKEMREKEDFYLALLKNLS